MAWPRRPLFVLFGSSIVQKSFGDGGWGASLADLYARKADIVLRGYNGWNSRHALRVVEKVFPRDASIQPSLVIVYFGGNDSHDPRPSGEGPHVPLQEYVENMQNIARHLMSLSNSDRNTRIIFLSCPPVNEDQIRVHLSLPADVPVPRKNENCRVYSEACIRLCQDLNLKVVDLWTAMQRRDDWRSACFTDGAHFTKEGSDIVVQEILKVLRQAEWEPSLHYRSMPLEFDDNSPWADGASALGLADRSGRREHQWKKTRASMSGFMASVCLCFACRS